MQPSNIRLSRAGAGNYFLAAGAASLLTLTLATPPVQAAGGKLLLTGGVSSIDGAAGGGLTPWAVTGSYATQGQFGGSAFATTVRTQNYDLLTTGVGVSYGDRIELTIARQDFDVHALLAPLGISSLRLKQDIVGLKLRVAGDAVLDSDSMLPQVAIGLLHKRSDSGALEPTLTGALGAHKSGREFYVSATKLFLAQGIVVNGTLRATKANQNGLLGFGGAQADKIRLMPEVSVAWLVHRSVALGVEARAKPDNLKYSVLGTGALQEDDWVDVFVAWAPSKHFSLTAAWVDLGKIVPALQPRRQTGGYLSAQIGF